MPTNYANNKNWVWGYGSLKKDYEYVIHISGGGDPNTPNGFEDWVIKPSISGGLKYYIRHGTPDEDKEQKGKKLVSCPEGNYVSWQKESYELKDEELDFEWLEDEFDSMYPEDEKTAQLYKKKIEDLEKANVFLKNITEAQTQKISDLKDETEYYTNKIGELEAENEELEEQKKKLDSNNNNLMCVINHLKIDYKKVLAEIEADCEPDAHDSM